MDPEVVVTLAFKAADEIITLIKHIRGQGNLTDEQLIASADAQDLQNKEDIKKLLAL